MQSHQPTPKQSGFSAIEVLLVVLVVATLTVTGLVVYQRHKPSSAKNSAATSQTQTPTQSQNTTPTQPAQATMQYLEIKEWGVRMALTSNTASLYYYIDPQIPDVAYLSLKTVSDIAPDCAADKGSLAAIGRQTPAVRQDALNKGLQVGTLQVGSYWYAYDHSHADCTDCNTAEQAAIAKAQPAYNLEDVFKTLSAVPSTN